MGTKVVFSNMPKSKILESFVDEEIDKVVEGHVGSAGFKTRVNLEMENSPQQPGLDAFKIMVRLKIKGLKEVVLLKRSADMYAAIREAMDALRNTISKAHNRRKERKRKRSFKRAAHMLDYPGGSKENI